jgi:hypothetical protein
MSCEVAQGDVYIPEAPALLFCIFYSMIDYQRVEILDSNSTISYPCVSIAVGR